MKKTFLQNSPISKKILLALGCFITVFIITCKQYEKQAERDDLDNQISNLTQEIKQTQDFHTATVPDYLHNTQSRYIKNADSLSNNADSLENCIRANDSLITSAYNKYAERIGKDFQISKYLSPADIAVFQKHIKKLDSTEILCTQARQRILNNNGSMHDLSYFFEMFDFDSINTELENKLAWNFYPENLDADDTTTFEVGTLDFENAHLNQMLRAETKLLDQAWRRNDLYEKLKLNDSLRMADTEHATDSVSRLKIAQKYDSIKTQIIDNFRDIEPSAPNFSIPEFDSVRTQYAHNDSIINKYENTFDGMTRAEDSLIQYRQTIIRKRDSLIKKRKDLEK